MIYQDLIAKAAELTSEGHLPRSVAKALGMPFYTYSRLIRYDPAFRLAVKKSEESFLKSAVAALRRSAESAPRHEITYQEPHDGSIVIITAPEQQP